MSEPDVRDSHDPSEKLARLERLCRLRGIALYRDQALYLQILRDELQTATRQALFNLLSEVDASRFSRLSESDRSRFHGAIDGLVSRCSVLLTVEQLMQLMNQMQEEQLQHQANASREMLQGLSRPMKAEDQLGQPASPQPPMEPDGSIHLSLASPLDFPQQPASAGDSQLRPNEPLTDPSAETQNEGDLEVLRSLFQLAGEAMHAAESDDFESNRDFEFSGFDADPAERSPHLLPTRPDSLLFWMESMEQALQRRLRNLSHAVNVQMLRSGLAQALLPINLLDAALKGQIETQPAATNVLRLRLPLAVGEQEAGMDVFCLMLRGCDLEFDSHRLRHCRKRLHEHHRSLLKMVQQQRHWERRSLDREARTLWQNPVDPMQPASGD